VLLILATLCLGIGCGDSGKDRPKPSTSNATTQPAAKPGTAQNERPQWIARRPTWPDTMRFTADSTLEIRQDDLMIRLRTSVGQDVQGMSFKGEQPLTCDILMTIRPVPEWPLAKGLVLDSVVFHDPVKKRDLRALAMLSFRRTADGQTVRTQYATNLGERFRRSPDLIEGQDLVPTIYLSWDGKIIIASMPPVKLTYTTEQ